MLALPHLVLIYIRWICLRALLHRGWWLVTSYYLVVDAELSALQLVLLGTAQGIAVLLCEVPTGLIADNYSRKWSLVISQVLMGAAMIATSQASAFGALVITQVLWGVSWTFASGADVAWLTDELDDNANISRFLAIAARWEIIGSAVGLCVFGSIAWVMSPSYSMLLAGLLMVVLGAHVAMSFAEHRHPSGIGRSRTGLVRTLQTGINVTRRSSVVMAVFVVTFIVNGADEIFNRLYTKHLVELGMPSIQDSMLWLTLLGTVSLGVGALSLRVIQGSLQSDSQLNAFYVSGCLLGVAGLILFAYAPSYPLAMAGYILVHGIAWNLVRTLGSIRVNNHTGSDSRATIQSFLSFSENLGEICIGFTLALVAAMAGISVALGMAAGLVLAAVVVVLWSG